MLKNIFSTAAYSKQIKNTTRNIVQCTCTNIASHFHSTQRPAVIAEVILNCWVCHLK